MSDDSGLYIQMFSIHGLLRSRNLEMGRDADTGGQIKYVVELGKALSQSEGVRRVDLFTRLIKDKRVSEDYGKAVERVNDKFNLVRIQCGGRRYFRKELLWPHLDEYVDKTIKYIKRSNRIPDVVHGHYPDAGYVAMQLADIFGVPFVYTGHSLGRTKRQKLLNEGMRENEMVKRFKIDYRIQIEEEVLKKADRVIASTSQEVEQQWAQYDNKDLPEFRVIPPGLDIERFYPFYHDRLSDADKGEIELYAKASVLEELNRFFMNPDRPLILSLCRPDKRKNISGLIKAYGEDLELRSMANLAVFAGLRKDISDMEENERDVLTEILLLMDKYDLYGKIAIPKRHDFEYEVPELYRIAAEKRGVFVNSALTEPFGITLIEAAACGLPVVAPDDGGPRDIIGNCRCGVLVDTTDTAQLAAATKKIITDGALWKQFSHDGVMSVRRHYTWESHAASYVKEIDALIDESGVSTVMDKAKPYTAVGQRLLRLNHFLVADLDNTLIGGSGKELEALRALLQTNQKCLGFGIASGRTVESIVDALKQHDIALPDLIIAGVGAELYYGSELKYGQGWETHIKHMWDRRKVVRLLKKFDFLRYQEEEFQREFKVSYILKPGKDRLALIHDKLLRNGIRYSLSLSKNKYLDILPYRASKGKAIRYLSYKWEIPLGNFLVCGDAGSDEEMLRGEPKGVVVGNYSRELDALKGRRNIYFADRTFAGGILEGIEHYNFEEKARRGCRPE